MTSITNRDGTAMRFAAVAFVLAMFAVAGMPEAAHVVGSASIRAPAVILSNNTGDLTTINLTVYSGNGMVSIPYPAEVGNSTLQSAQEAAAYASSYLSLNASRYDFVYEILDGGGNVSGPSAGAAMTMLAISALSGKTIPSNFTMTGTISRNGTVGLVGGVYDKISAAHNAGMKFVLVPRAPGASLEADLYVLTADAFNMPVVEVSNVSDAYAYVFGGRSVYANTANVSLYDKYDLGALGGAGITCSNSCDYASFDKVVNVTFGLANDSIGQLAMDRNFSNVVAQLRASMAQNAEMVSKGYKYLGADFAFFTYITAYYFNSYLTNRTQGLQAINDTERQCASISIPVLTGSNYEFVLGGELRQAWGEYTANSLASEYNASTPTTDEILAVLYSLAPANAWCSAAELMYNVSGGMGFVPVMPNASLATAARERVDAAAKYGDTMYLVTAREALAVKNYPLALLDADYAYATGVAAGNSTLPTGRLLNMSETLAKNATYGIWATQFANDALFYRQMAGSGRNATAASSTAYEAYSSAVLADMISRDTRLIYESFVPGYVPQLISNSTAPGQQASPTVVTNQFVDYVTTELNYLLIVAAAGLVVSIVALAVVIYVALKVRAGANGGPGRDAGKGRRQ